jgi:hypothetical protein
MKQIKSSKWYCIKKDHIHQCCGCGRKEMVEIKVDKQKKVWMRVWI